MMRRSVLRIALVLGAAGVARVPAQAQSGASAPNDTVILRVTSPRGVEVAFNGTITLRDRRTEQRIENQRTPFEVRLPRQNVDARFTASDGFALGGEIISIRDGRPSGHVTGTVHVGEVKLFYERGQGFGFGSRYAGRGRALP